MAIVKIKPKFQITVPVRLRTQLTLKVGDLLEAIVKNGRIEFSPKILVDRNIALAEEDIKAGRYLGPFKTAEEGIRALRHATKKLKTESERPARRRAAKK